MSIRNAFALTTIVILALAAMTAGALLKTISSTQQLSEMSNRNMQSVRASEELQVALLRYSRENLLGLHSGVAPSRETRRRMESEITSKISEVKTFIDSGEERDHIEEIERLTSEYLDFHERIARQSLPRDSGPRNLPPVLNRAIDTSDKLARLNLEQAYANKRDIDSANVSAVRTAATFGIISLVFLLLAWVGVHRWIYRPVALLSKRIDSFSGSDLNRRFVENGPKEARAISSAFNRLSARIMSQRDASLRFLAAVAHDLRNPLSAIRMSSELLKDESRISGEHRTIIDIISRQTQHLDRMVGDLLDTTRIQSGQLELRKEIVDVTKLVRDSGLLHKSLSQVHSVEIRVPDRPIYSCADSLRVSQVLNNLLNNAIKYSPKGGRVEIRLSVIGMNAVIEVSDQGIGIDQSDIAGIFEPFKRTTATKETIPGVGLGLSVAQRIIKAHEGKIEVSSSPERGSIFRVHLPLHQEVSLGPRREAVI